MSKPAKHLLVDFMWGVGIGAALLFLGQLVYDYVQDPVPYKDVVVTEARVDPLDSNNIIIGATFYKLQCEFVRLEVFKLITGVPIIIEWHPLDQRDRNIDRTVGEQFLFIVVVPKGTSFDALEIRTRHLCDDVNVDKMFTRIYAEDIEGFSVVAGLPPR